ncbi:hypothetical protein D3C86_1559000 [compost metagenome]
MAKDKAWRTLKTALKVLVRKRRWAISLKNSRLCFLGCSGYFSASLSPSISIDVAFTSTLCPFPTDSTTIPFTAIAAPVVMRFNKASSVLLKSTTIWMFPMQEPSFIAINWLLRKVRTHPITVTSLLNSSVSSRLFTFSLCIMILLWRASKLRNFMNK